MAFRFSVASLAVFAALSVVACSAASDEDGTATADDSEEALSGNAQKINIGFNAGYAEQFGYFADFNGKTNIHPGPSICHTYVGYDIADENELMGNASSPEGHRAYFEYWLTQAEGHCDEALISFKAKSHHNPPTGNEFETDFSKFLETDWKKETGFTGTLSFTAWNEPNNPADPGNGLGVVIPPETAADYFLAAAFECRAHGGCKVAAGDFASNGNMWDAYEFNCFDDTVPANKLCDKFSDVNPSHHPASYLDRYKNFIVNHANADYGLGDGYRPAYFAFHGWHDINDYLNDGDHCNTYDTCATRRLLKSLGGSWVNVKIWDSEVGVDQSATDTISDGDQACGAAFLMRLTALSPRIERMYYTRLHNGGDKGGALLDGHALRKAGVVLAQRELEYNGQKCK